MRKFLLTTRGNYRHTSHKKRVWALMVVGLILIFLLVVTPIIMATIASLAVTPVMKVRSWFTDSSASLPVYLRERNELLTEMNTLRSQLVAAEMETPIIQTLLKENKELRALLGYESEDRILASVIARPGHLPNDVLMLDRGKRHGVFEDAPVFIGDHVVIGKIVKSTPFSSLVKLISSPGYESTVFVLGPDIFTTAIGVGGGQVRIGVPQGIPISVGDPVLTPVVRSGIYGSISHIQTSPTQPEQYGFVSTDIPLSSLRFVAVGSTPLVPISFKDAEVIVTEQRKNLFSIPVPEDILVDIPEEDLNNIDGLLLETATSTDEVVSDDLD